MVTEVCSWEAKLTFFPAPPAAPSDAPAVAPPKPNPLELAPVVPPEAPNPLDAVAGAPKPPVLAPVFAAPKLGAAVDAAASAATDIDAPNPNAPPVAGDPNAGADAPNAPPVAGDPNAGADAPNASRERARCVSFCDNPHISTKQGKAETQPPASAGARKQTTI